MMEKPAHKLSFELGQWITTEDGYGQIIYIRPLFVEKYETDRKDRKNGEFIRYIYICKLLCDFKGRTRTKISIYTSISKLDKEGADFIKDIKKNKPNEYHVYIVFDDKTDLCRQVFLDYKVENKADFNFESLKQELLSINNKLYPTFTFSEFLKECNNHSFPIKIENFIPYGHTVKKEEKITLRFDSYLYKVKGKESVFHKVSLFH